MSLGCDVVAVGTKAYLEGAQSLEQFGKKLKSHFGENVSPDVIEAAYKTAAKSYRTQHGALEQIKAEMAKTIISEARKNRTGLQKFGDSAMSISGLPRTLMTTADLSMTLRQAWAVSLSHPHLATKAMQDQIRAMFGSKKYGVTGEGWAHQVDAEIKARPNYQLYQDSGLFLAPIEKGIGDLLRHEEAYQSNIPEHIPGVGRVVRSSERAAITYLNKMRADVFDSLAKNAGIDAAAPDVASAKKIADFVNNATGRGNLPETLNVASQLLSSVFFSPKLVASRVGYLKEAIQYGAKGLAEPVASRFGKGMSPVEKAIATEYARTAVAVATIYGVLNMAGADIGTDPRSSDFGKARFGKMRVDLMGGHQQYLVFLSRMLTGETTNGRGQIRSLDDQAPTSSTRGDVAAHFARGKLAPLVGVGVDALVKKQSPDYPNAEFFPGNGLGNKASRFLSNPSEIVMGGPGTRPLWQRQIGSDFLGRPTTLKSDAERMLIPLHVSGFAQTLAEGEGLPKAAFGAVAEMLGAGVNTYSSGKQPRVPEQPITDFKDKKMRELGLR